MQDQTISKFLHFKMLERGKIHQTALIILWPSNILVFSCSRNKNENKFSVGIENQNSS